jgi:hypothetical protein
MILQPPQGTVRAGSQSRAGFRVALLEVKIVQLKEPLRQRLKIRVATGLLAQRFAITPERAWTVADDNADDGNTGVAGSKLSIVKDQP